MRDEGVGEGWGDGDDKKKWKLLMGEWDRRISNRQGTKCYYDVIVSCIVNMGLWRFEYHWP